MQELERIQKQNNLNRVFREGETGPGGAFHEYRIVKADSADEVLLRVAFQKGPRQEATSQHGVLDTDLLEIVRDRLQEFQKGDFATRENAIALTHIEEALLWMAKRVADRVERNVLGTYQK